MTATEPPPFKRTKIVGTLGPASLTPTVLGNLVDAGLNVCRLNFSHGDLAGHKQALDLVRSIAAERDQPITVLGDLCGPKIRLNPITGAQVTLARGDTVRFVRGDGEGTPDRLTTSYPRFVDEIEVGHRVFIDDGLVRFLVTERTRDELVATCTTGGVISSRKGINLPNTRLDVPSLTEKDLTDLSWALENRLDYVALSFVRGPRDVSALRDQIAARRGAAGVVVKIEKPEALHDLDGILALADAVMVARGDLGVEIDVWQVPAVQRRIVARARTLGKPVIVATQMLQSMIQNPTPTRAEVNDVATAVLEGADAVMLSAETAVGKYPELAVDIMSRVALTTEEHLSWRPTPHAPDVLSDRPWTAGLANAAVEAAHQLGAKLIAAWTATGATVRQLALHRVPLPIVGLTYDERVLRRLNLIYGVVPILVSPISVPAEMASVLDAHLLKRGLALPGDTVVVICSTRPSQRGATDTVLVHRVARAAGP